MFCSSKLARPPAVARTNYRECRNGLRTTWQATRQWIRCNWAVAIVRGGHAVSRSVPHFCSALHELDLDGCENKPVRPLILRREVARRNRQQRHDGRGSPSKKILQPVPQPAY